MTEPPPPVLPVGEDLPTAREVGLCILGSILLGQHGGELEAVAELVLRVSLLRRLSGSVSEGLDGAIEVASVVAQATEHLGDDCDL